VEGKYMPKCSVVGCNQRVIGGFQKLIDVTNSQSNTRETIPGSRTFWCKEHEEHLNRGLGSGRYLNTEEPTQEQL
jgi:hypothetical protein